MLAAGRAGAEYRAHLPGAPRHGQPLSPATPAATPQSTARARMAMKKLTFS